MNTVGSTHVYTFTAPHVYLNVVATDLSSAVDRLKVIFGEKWVRQNLDKFDIKWFKSKTFDDVD